MPEWDDNVTGVRFTVAQKAWLQREAARLDRSIAWIMRSLVDEKISGSTSAKERVLPKQERRMA